MDVLDYIIKNLSIGWESGDHVYGIIEIVGVVVAGLLTCRKKFAHHREPWEDFLRKFMWKAVVWTFVLMTIAVAPYIQVRESIEAKEKAQKQLDDKAPKLHGFVNRSMIAAEPGTSNSLIFMEVTVGNSGGSPSMADEFGAKIILPNGVTTNAEAIYFPDEYEMNFWYRGQPYRLDLKRPELISERAHNAIQPGDSPRGWLAFRVPGIQQSEFTHSNIVVSFIDINDKKISFTNDVCVWKEKKPDDYEADAINMVLAGSENIFYPVPPTVETNTGWMPPPLPPGCSNVVVYFGAMPFVLPIKMAEVSPDLPGTEFAIKDLPDIFLKDLDKVPNYSPRMKTTRIRSWMNTIIGGRTIPSPVQPVVVSNRLYIEVEIPFSNEKRKLVMSDSFCSDLPIPRLWDVNYSTNYGPNGGIYAFEVVNELTNPVLQVGYTAPNVVHVNGIFQVDSNCILASFGGIPELCTFALINDPTQSAMKAALEIDNFRETLVINSNETLADFGQRFTNELFRPIFKYQRPIFKYPSYRNLGVFQSWEVETNSKGTNTSDLER